MHTTEARKKAKTLKAQALELARDAKAARRAAKVLPEGEEKACKLERQAEEMKAEAEDLKNTARLEDLHLWQMKKVKTTKKGNRAYRYWMANWREGGKVRNVHLGSCCKMDKETARQKAKAIKAEALAIKQ